MILALIPGLDPTLAVDRSQQMPDPADIVHTATIDPDHKGYVDPDQVVYSIILGSDIGDFSFNWIGLVEAVTDTVIAITTTPETPKRKTNLGNNTTGNNITRNFMIQFQDAQNLTAITVAAETWQFDYQAEFSSHEALVVDPSQAGSVAKHVTNSQAKIWQDHAVDPHDYAPFDGDASQVFKAAAGVAGNDVVVKSQSATATNTGLVELATNAETQAGTDMQRAITPAGLAASALGIGQTWTNVTSSRSLVTTYTNTTGRSIFVVVRGGVASGGSMVFFVNGSSNDAVGNGADVDVSSSVRSIVPNGSTYKVTNTGGTKTFWGELR
jgi:hypothetical protein